MKKGCPYGTHRVISPAGVLPQPADKIDNTMEIYDNEVLIDVKTLNIDSASFTEIVKRVLNKKPSEVTTQEAIHKMALDVIAGKYGNGITRKNNIYKAIQAEVNKILK